MAVISKDAQGKVAIKQVAEGPLGIAVGMLVGGLIRAVKQMKVEAAEIEARLQNLKQAGSESWTSLSAALAETRKAFDQANQKAWDAFKRAGQPKS
jgi:hypothetical protein